jgi:hypothetical protein
VCVLFLFSGCVLDGRLLIEREAKEEKEISQFVVTRSHQASTTARPFFFLVET